MILSILDHVLGGILIRVCAIECVGRPVAASAAIRSKSKEGEIFGDQLQQYLPLF
jgi:hypothetical protein